MSYIIPNNYSTQHKVKPSELESLKHCTYQANLKEPMEQKGTRLHMMIEAAILQTYGQGSTIYGRQDLIEYASETERLTVSKYVEKIGKQLNYYRNYTIETEAQAPTHLIDNRLSDGRIDCLIYGIDNTGKRRTDVIDIKTGQGQSSLDTKQNSPQLIAYGLAIAQTIETDVLYTHVLKPQRMRDGTIETDKINDYFYRLEQYENEKEKIIGLIDETENGGKCRDKKACYKCNHRQYCPIRYEQILKIQRKEKEKEPLTWEDKLSIYAETNKIQNILKENRKEVIERINNGTETKGYQVKRQQNLKPNMDLLFSMCNDYGLNLFDFLQPISKVAIKEKLLKIGYPEDVAERMIADILTEQETPPKLEPMK